MEISDAEKEDVQVLFLRFTARSGSAVTPPLGFILPASPGWSLEIRRCSLATGLTLELPILNLKVRCCVTFQFPLQSKGYSRGKKKKQRQTNKQHIYIHTAQMVGQSVYPRRVSRAKANFVFIHAEGKIISRKITKRTLKCRVHSDVVYLFRSAFLTFIIKWLVHISTLHRVWTKHALCWHLAEIYRNHMRQSGRKSFPLDWIIKKYPSSGSVSAVHALMISTCVFCVRLRNKWCCGTLRYWNSNLEISQQCPLHHHVQKERNCATPPTNKTHQKRIKSGFQVVVILPVRPLKPLCCIQNTQYLLLIF